MIAVLVDDLAFLDVDAVLRPANEVLEPVTPAMTRLDERAGAAFQDQRRVQFPFDAGAAVVTGAGNLVARFVVHVVVQSRRTDPGPDVIRRGLISAWQRASDWELATVAAPLIGTGAGQLPPEEAATLLAETFREHRTRSRFPEALSIVLEREADRTAVEAAIARFQS